VYFFKKKKTYGCTGKKDEKENSSSTGKKILSHPAFVAR
jgi:hypothetical protein